MKITLSIGFLGALTITFITLKLCHVIFWSWWFVLLPLYGGIAIFFGLAFSLLIIILLAAVPNR